MKAFMAFLVVVATLVGFYYAYIFVTKKAFQPPPKQEKVEPMTPWQSQSERNRELMDRQRDLMRQRQDQMRDQMRR